MTGEASFLSHHYNLGNHTKACYYHQLFVHFQQYYIFVNFTFMAIEIVLPIIKTFICHLLLSNFRDWFMKFKSHREAHNNGSRHFPVEKLLLFIV